MERMAIAYLAKSSEDRKGSLGTQLEDCRAMAAREGWTLAADYRDEGFSAFKWSRGPGLEAAKRHAASLRRSMAAACSWRSTPPASPEVRAMPRARRTILRRSLDVHMAAFCVAVPDGGRTAPLCAGRFEVEAMLMRVPSGPAPPGIDVPAAAVRELGPDDALRMIHLRPAR